MELWYPHAEHRPLGPETQGRISPRIFIVHTMVGSLRGTHNMFARNGYTGLESTFGLGGPGDSDGVLYQWQSLNHSADAQAAGNAYGTSVETADAGNPDHPWSDAQLAALVSLGTWWARQVGAPGRIVTGLAQKGFGYHRQFTAWNPHNHSCPGDVRLRQYIHDVVPAIADNLAGPKHSASGTTTVPASNVHPNRPTLHRVLRVGDHGGDVRLVQHLVGAHLDNIYGPATKAAVRRWQDKHNLTPDGVFGPASARAAGWIWKGATSV